MFVASPQAYNLRIANVESLISQRLTQRLGDCVTANEMFRVCAQFKALLERPRIAGAIQQFQSHLLDTVKQDIEALRVKFTKQYDGSGKQPRLASCGRQQHRPVPKSPSWLRARFAETARLSVARDLPPLSGKIIWARQLAAQLNAYLSRVADVLGPSWMKHVEGERLNELGQSFLAKLDTKAMFDEWLASIQSHSNLQVNTVPRQLGTQ